MISSKTINILFFYILKPFILILCAKNYLKNLKALLMIFMYIYHFLCLRHDYFLLLIIIVVIVIILII